MTSNRPENNIYRQLEKIVKGFANHRRIEIARLLEREPGLSLIDISDHLRINFKTASEHVRRLTLAGLVSKKYHGANVHHQVTDLGGIILKFLRILEKVE